MARLNPQSAATGVLVFIISLTTCLVLFNLFSGAEQASSRKASSAPWVSPVDDVVKVTGPVASVLIEQTELGTDEPPTELDRHPSMEFHFDTSGRLTKRMNFVIPDGTPKRGASVTYVYDDEGRLVKKQNHSAIDDSVMSETTYTYDERGRPAEAVEYDVKRKYPPSKEIYKHDPERNYTEVEEYWGEVLRTKAGYVRDDAGSVVEHRELSTMFQSVGTVGYAGKGVYTFNEHGDHTQVFWYDAEGKLEEIKSINYEYDTQGNWVKRTVRTEDFTTDPPSNRITDITYRIITYNK